MADPTSTLDPRTPVIVAVGQVEQRPGPDGTAVTDGLEPTALLAEAARAAQRDSGSERLLAALDTIAVMRIVSWRYRDPARLVADHLGLAEGAVRTIATDDGGNYPQTLINRAAREIQAGTARAVLIGGAETWRSRTTARKQGLDLAWTTQPDDVEPSESLANPDELGHPGEWARRLMMPIEIYPLFENAFRAARGWGIDEHRDRISALWSRFSEVAAANPHAWIRQHLPAAQIREPGPDNRMVGFPYTKLMNANNAVEQAAAVVICSVETARDLAIPTDRWIFPWSGTDAHEHWFVSHRWSLAEAPAIGLAGRAALDLAGVGVDDLAHIDVYSCFPSAVQIAATEIGLGLDRPLTVTGGLSFAGGPWNNYVTHSIATMVERLRTGGDEVGLVTANGGFLTKHAMGVYGARPPATPFRHRDLQAEVDVLPRRDLAEDFEGEVTIETSTVMHDRDSQPERAIVAVLLADGRRAWGLSTEPSVMKTLVTEETAGRSAHLSSDGTLTL